jgi:hypothetical protein
MIPYDTDNSRDHLDRGQLYMSALKPIKESEFLESEEVEKKSAVDKFYGMMNLGLSREESRNGKAD